MHIAKKHKSGAGNPAPDFFHHILFNITANYFAAPNTSSIVSFANAPSPPRTNPDTIALSATNAAAASVPPSFVSTNGAPSAAAKGPPQRPSGKFFPFATTAKSASAQNVFAISTDVSYLESPNTLVTSPYAANSSA